jgi:triosephosphate isomerase (TIM)
MAATLAQRRPLVLGNWKMNGDVGMAEHLLGLLRESLAESVLAKVDVGVCPPYPYLGLAAARLAGTRLGWGAQDVSAFDNGAYTGDVSAAMLADLGCRWTLVGHSERRTLFGDTDADVAAKAGRAVAVGLVPVVCVGETLEEREAGATEAVLGRQVDAVSSVLAEAARRGEEGFVIAYEPVWAIGTGLTATPGQAQAAHAFLRARLAERGIAGADRTRILYGGSVKAANAATLFAQADVDGGLIGGASLVAADFVEICAAAAGRQ